MESIRNMLISGEMQIGMSATILIALIIATFKLSSYISSLRNDIKINRTDIVDIKIDVKSNTTKIHDIEISDTENKTRILGIDARVVEILSILKEKKDK